MKRVLVIVGTVVILMTSLVTPVAAKPAPTNEGGMFQPYWQIANVATMSCYYIGGDAEAELYYEIPSAATARYNYRIEERSASGGSWRSVESDSAIVLPSSENFYYVSCSARNGYEYRVVATMTIKLSGKTETITFTEEA